MADLFHEDVTEKMLDAAFAEMLDNPHHIFFILTKRPERMAEYLAGMRRLIHYPKNLNHIWFGVSVEDSERMERLEILSEIDGIHRFVSFEPLVGEIRIIDWTSCLSKMDWIICGAETGSRARPISGKTVYDLSFVAKYFGVPFFFKKWGNKRNEEGMQREIPEFRKELS